MRKRTGIVMLTVALLTSSLSGCGSSEGDTEVTAGENQRLAYAVVTTIEGNEMTYMEVDESQLNLSSDTESGDEETAGTEDSSGGRGGFGSFGGGSDMNSSEMPQMSDGDSGQMPQMNGDSSQTQQSDGDSAQTQQSGGDNAQMPQMDSSEMPTGGPSFDMDSTETPQEGGGMDTSKMSGTTATVQIPVGVTVHTTSDTNTTFSRIQSGDVLKILYETDEDGNEVIVEIWMVQ